MQRTPKPHAHNSCHVDSIEIVIASPANQAAINVIFILANQSCPEAICPICVHHIPLVDFSSHWPSKDQSNCPQYLVNARPGAVFEGSFFFEHTCD